MDKKYGKWSARAYDLSRLTWPELDSTPDPLFEYLVKSYPSEYFISEDPSTQDSVEPIPLEVQRSRRENSLNSKER